MNDIIKKTGGLSGVRVTPIRLDEPFIDFAHRFSARAGTVLLLSGSSLDCARYHILGVNPWLRLRVMGREIRLTVDEESFSFTGNPFEILQALIRNLRLPEVERIPQEDGMAALPVKTGLFGYLSYDLKDALEVLPRTSVDDLRLPHLYLVVPSVVLVHDRKTEKTWQCIPERTGAAGPISASAMDALFWKQASVPPLTGGFYGDIENASAGFTREGYMTAVAAIKDYIAAGHVYQVNLSQRFEMAFKGDPFALFQRLYAMNPAPFYSFIHAEDHTVVSTSPERFIKRNGDDVETRPIKGTRPRGKTAKEDAAFRLDLVESRKDDAELSMIVDLLRNDIGKVCRAGSVRVVEHKRIEAYQNVWHLVSIVEGTLMPERDSVDLIRATFPGGSITGCPKIRAMEVIDELEPVRRHIYTGAIGYIGFEDTMDLSIAIRTATVLNDRLVFSVGGGIVYDSNPADEYEETLHKGRTLMTVLKNPDETGFADAPVIWLNGTFRHNDTARVPVSDQGVLYGFGFFETIRAVNGQPRRLQAHLDRFGNTWKTLFETEPPDLTWSDIVAQLLERNHLDKTVAAVKILATRGDREVPPYNYQLLVTARPYIHRLNGKRESGLRLAVYREPRLTPLAAHKTTNYLYYLRAGQWAKASGGDEALILNPDGSVSETNSAGILCVKGCHVFLPSSEYSLPSIMQRTISEILPSWGYTVEKRRLTVQELTESDEILVANALMGAVPILTVDSVQMPVPSDLSKRINFELL